MNVSIVGAGYVGLVTGCCLAEAGHQVVCVDNNEKKVAGLQDGIIPIYEPRLEDILSRNKSLGRLKFSSSLKEGVAEAKVIFLALPTPPMEDGSADLSAILSVANQLGSCLPENYCVIVDKSTVPVGTAETVREIVSKQTKSPFDVVSNPEFLREGHAIEDFTRPERVVVGVDTLEAEKVMKELYSVFTDEEHPLYITNQRTAELTKYAANTFLVTKINFMNEIAQLCELMDADVDILRQAIGADSRIGHRFLHPGIGCGGSCFPKDIRALKHMSEEYNYEFKLLSAALTINDQQQKLLVTKLMGHFGGDVKGKTFALWGLAFKPNTDDIREAPALVIINSLLEAGAKIIAFDPEAADNVRALYKDNDRLSVVDDKFEALKNAEALLVATEWPEFATADLSQIAEILAQPLVFDGRNIFQISAMQQAGFTYYSIGRRPVISSVNTPS